MKRFLPLLLVLLLLAGCSKENTESSTQPTTIQTEPTGLHIADHDVEVATSGAIWAYDISGAAIYAVPDGVALVDADGKFLVLDSAEGTILDTASQIKNILAVDDTKIFYYNEAVFRYDYVTDQVDSWKIPQDIQGDFAIGTKTQEIYYCMSGGIYGMNMETGLSRLIKQHFFEQQTILDAYFGGDIIGWETEAGIAYISTTDGTELSLEQGIYEIPASVSQPIISPPK